MRAPIFSMAAAYCFSINSPTPCLHKKIEAHPEQLADAPQHGHARHNRSALPFRELIPAGADKRGKLELRHQKLSPHQADAPGERGPVADGIRAGNGSEYL